MKELICQANEKTLLAGGIKQIETRITALLPAVKTNINLHTTFLTAKLD